MSCQRELADVTLIKESDLEIVFGGLIQYVMDEFPLSTQCITFDQTSFDKRIARKHYSSEVLEEILDAMKCVIAKHIYALTPNTLIRKPVFYHLINTRVLAILISDYDLREPDHASYPRSSKTHRRRNDDFPTP